MIKSVMVRVGVYMSRIRVTIPYVLKSSFYL